MTELFRSLATAEISPRMVNKLAHCEEIARTQARKSAWYLGGMTDEDYAIVCRFAWGHHISRTGDPAATLRIANRYRDNLNA